MKKLSFFWKVVRCFCSKTTFTCIAASLLFSTSIQSQNLLYYLGNASDVSHFRVIEDATGTSSITASGTALKLTSTNSGYFYMGTQRMGDASRSFINATDLLPVTPDSNVTGTITIKIANQPAPGKFSVNLGLYSVNNNCSIRSMPVPSSNVDVNQSITYNTAHQADGSTFTMDFSSAAIRTQFRNAYAKAVADYGTSERPEGFVLKFYWSSYTGSQSSIEIDEIKYSAPINMGVTPVSCFNSSLLLPVSLTSFTATPANVFVQINWAVAMEQNISSYTIERSADGRSFSSVGYVLSTGGSSTLPKSYSYNDVSPVLGNSWYRLKIIDADGSIKYSPVKAVFHGKDMRQTLLIKNSATVQSVDVAGWNLQHPAIITITDMEGRVIRSGTVAIESRVITLSEQVPSGIYLIRLQQNNRETTTRLVF